MKKAMFFQRFLVALFVAFIALVVASEEEREMQEGKIGFTFDKANGRFMFLKRRPRGKKPNFAKAGFHLELHSLKQQNGSGGDIGRSINSFAGQPFHILPLNRTASFQGISAASLEVTTMLKYFHANLSLQLFVFKEEGNITFGNESYGVQNGSIKMFIKLENFTFCDGQKDNQSMCKQNEVGEFLEIAVRVKNRKGATGKKESDEEKKKRGGPFKPGEGKKKTRIRCFRCPNIYRFGDDEVGTASQCKSDGKFRSLAPGFPKLIERGTNQLFLFRGPKFNRTITFDPVVELEEEEDNGSQNGQASIINMNTIMFVAIIGTFFF
ncbi:skeletal aspartic acid-rich protein 1-like isoform X1 [Montipora foliosa]|uniref:skeletal aspartic acid-rich protein 1-like isoform X1 n=1 Tax=Montipora foliosa TaxID=591990 RepID=UPI0035F1C921